MNCSEMDERLVDILYGEMPEPSRREMEEHLRACPRCEATVAAHRRALDEARAALTGPLAQEPPARARVAALRAATAAARQRQPGTDPPVATAKASPPREARPGTRDLDGGRSAGLFGRLWRAPWLLPAFGAAGIATAVLLVRVLKDPEVLRGQSGKSLRETEVPAEQAAPPAPAVPAPVATSRLPQLSPTAAPSAPVPAEPAKARQPTAARKATRAPGPPAAPAPKGASPLASSAPGDSEQAPFEALRFVAPARAPVGPTPARAPASPAPAAAPTRDHARASADAVARTYAQPPPVRAGDDELKEERASKAALPAAEAGHAVADEARRADRLYAAQSWSAAAQAYRTLLARYPRHADAAKWRARMEQAMLADGPTRPPSTTPAAPKDAKP